MRTQILVLIITSFVTVLIRALPFFLGNRFSESEFIKKFSDFLTPALIGMLVVYCLKDISFQNKTGIDSLVCVGLCVVSYVWKRNALISIVAPTVVYMLLINC